MKQTCTINDMIRFLYREIPANEALAMAAQLSNDYLLNEQFAEIAEAKSVLTSAKFNPSKETLNNILAYSKTAALEVI
jgi:hypothetical protein